MTKRYFLGWTNIKWFIREISKMYTADHSYFSKKRFESGASFLIGQAGMIFFLIMKYGVMTTGEFLGWATIEFAVAGYMVNQIQKEKSQLQSTTETPPDQPE